MKIKRLSQLVSATLLSISSLFVINMGTVLAAADTCTWTGATDLTFSNGGNWSGCDNAGVPENGDTLEFDNTSLGSDTTLNNDISNLNLAGINFIGTGTTSFTIGGLPLIISGNVTNTSSATYGHNLDLDIVLGANLTMSGLLKIGVLNSNTFNLSTYTLTMDKAFVECKITRIYSEIMGTGGITKTGTGEAVLWDANTFTGPVAISQGKLVIKDIAGLGTTAAGTTVSSGATLGIAVYSDSTIAEPITIGGTGVTDQAALVDYGGSCSGGGGVPDPRPVITLSGGITLTANANVYLGIDNFKITGVLSGAYSLSIKQGSQGVLIINSSNNTSGTSNGTVEPTAFTTNYTASSPSTYVTIANKETAIVTGTYGGVSVNNGGVFKGTGTVGDVVVGSGGTIAPGLSPGCINTGNLVQGGTYSAELGGTTACTGYDQINVTGTVDLTSGTLTTSLYNGFKPAAGNSFVIINNDGTDAVTGVLSSLAEGATFTVDGYVFKISYVGGTGNDVVLTVQSVPAAPSTGFALITTNPLATLVATVILTTALVVLSRRYNQQSAKK